MQKPNIVKLKNGDKDDFHVEPQVIVEAIKKIADAMKVLNGSALSREAILVLIASHSKLPKKTIEIVLNNLSSFDKIWLKKI